MPKEGSQSIRIEAYEWQQLKADAEAYDIAATRFPVLIWRNWKVQKWPLVLVGPLPEEGWEPKRREDRSK